MPDSVLPGSHVSEPISIDDNRPGSHVFEPISIDDDRPATEVDREVERLRGKYLRDQWFRNPGLSTEESDEGVIIEIEDKLPEEELAEETVEIDLTSDDGTDDVEISSQPGEYPDPTPIISNSEVELNEYTTPKGRLRLQKGVTVEIEGHIGHFCAQFLKIAAIVRRRDGQTCLRGHLYTRARNLRGMLERKLNEVVLVTDVTRDNRQDWNRQAMVDHDADADDVKCIRVLRTTNTQHPECGIDKHDYESRGKEWMLDHGHLVCRWHYILVFKDAQLRASNRADEWLIRRVTQEDADKPFAIDDEHSSNVWRGGRVPGGSVTPAGEHLETPVVDLESGPRDAAQERRDVLQRFYSGGDVFCGAGGASRGMVDAEIDLRFAVDHWDCAAATHRRNFGQDIIHEMDIFDFVTGKSNGCRVDILHMSPPCQFWSPAHTRPGVNDEVNMAALFSCGHVVEKVRPRIFTIEQTFGILFKRFQPYFNTLIGAFTSHGYSVRWKVVQFAAWGLCQKRRRLIVIGAAPGEHLPDFPKDSHHDISAKETDRDGRKEPLKTVKGVFTAVPRLRPGHNQHDETAATQRDNAPWDWDRQISTITCSGGQNNYHWSGKRDFTIREFAYLQGFPAQHVFEGPRGKCIKQIGNAVPPTMAQKLFEHLVKWLKIQDGGFESDDTDVKASAARQRLEKIKIAEADPNDDITVTVVTTRSGASTHQAIVINDAATTAATAGSGASAHQAIAIHDSDEEHEDEEHEDEEHEDDQQPDDPLDASAHQAIVINDSDEETEDDQEPDDPRDASPASTVTMTSDGTMVGSCSPSPGYDFSSDDQQPPDPKYKLQDFSPFLSHFSQVIAVDNDDNDDEDAQSDDTATIFGDDMNPIMVDNDDDDCVIMGTSNTGSGHAPDTRRQRRILIPVGPSERIRRLEDTRRANSRMSKL